MSEINVVPYIDVMLVLLVIFMVTAPLLIQGIKVDLPRAGAEPLDPRELKDQRPLVVSIDRAGLLYLDVGPTPGVAVDVRTAQARVTAVLRRSPDTAVLLKGDRGVEYGRIVDAMVMLQSAGASRVGFLTEPVVGEKPR